jgi:hypothetical protein
MKIAIALGVIAFSLASLTVALTVADRHERERQAEVVWLKARIEQYKQIIDETCNVVEN